MQAIHPLRVGLVGIGVGARQLLPALTTGAYTRLVGVADVRPAALEQVGREFRIPTYGSVEELAESPDVEAVWVATPNHLHAQHAIAVAERGKHAIVSKPMAITLDETFAMNAAAERNGVLLLAGHTQSMAPTIRKMAELVRTGELGKLGMLHTWHYTDWMYRPRLPAELDVSQGGGPVFRQASHQVDIVRSIAGGRVRSVRAMVVQLDPSRGAEGAYTAYLEFDDGTPASIVYSGYGHFSMGELLGRDTTGDHRGSARSGLAEDPRGPDVSAPAQPGGGDEAAHKTALRYGGEAASARPNGGDAAAPAQTTGGDEAAQKELLRYGGDSAYVQQASNSLGLFGLTLVTCERGDLRESSAGLFLYQRGEKTSIQVQDELRGAAELEELYHAVRDGAPLQHDGRWGEATLAVCLAIHESARTHAEIALET